MDAKDTRRRLIWHGIFLFLLSLLQGAVVQSFVNPRMALSAHVAGAMSGIFLIALGAAWVEIRLTAGMATAAFWLTLYGTYVGWVPLVLGAAWGTSRSTPLAGAGHSAAPWQESVVAFGLTSAAAAILVACVLLLRGYRRQR